MNLVDLCLPRTLAALHARPADEHDYIEYGESITNELIDRWCRLSSASLPKPVDAFDALNLQMRAEGDLGESQIMTFLDSWCPPRQGRERQWLRDCSERLLHWLRPWFGLWLSYTEWVIKWCQARSYEQIVFLGRDALPLYVAAQQLQPRLGADLELHVADVPRMLLDSPVLDGYLASVADFTRPTAVVDSGCYGTAVTRMAEYADGLTEASEDMAVMFFASRNPRIFGYLNYLMSSHYLSDCSEACGLRGPADFTVYALDVIESLPKPYRVFADRQRIRQAPTDVTSFLCGMRIYAEMSLRARTFPLDDADSAVRAADELFGRFARESADGLELILDEPAPKSPPKPEACERLGLTAFFPQSELFGQLAG